jgi:hypothetical protein
MPANPPTEITIGGRIISIRIDPRLEAWGEYHGDDAEIVLASRTLAKQSTLRETLRHEMLHAALDIYHARHIDGGTAHSVGTLADMTKMSYADHHAAKLGWRNSFAYGLHNTKTGKHEIWQIVKEGKDWISPMGTL